MKTLNFNAIITSIELLNFGQLKKIRHSVEAQISQNQVGQAIANREDAIENCPHCQSKHFNRWGQAKGRQRWMCKGCHRTFSATTGTAIYRMRKPDKWITYNSLMWSQTTLRDAAKILKINLRTSFRWRHAFLKMAAAIDSPEIAGVIESDETFVRESFKGKRKLNRRARKRGGYSKDQNAAEIPKVPILLVLNREGVIGHKVLEDKSKGQIQGFLRPRLIPGSVICTDANPSYKGLTNDLDVDHIVLNASKNERVKGSIYHIQTLNSYTSRWKLWMKKFCGVATKNLANYLSWFRFMRQNEFSKTCFLYSACMLQ